MIDSVYSGYLVDCSPRNEIGGVRKEGRRVWSFWLEVTRFSVATVRRRLWGTVPRSYLPTFSASCEQVVREEKSVW